MPETFNQIFVPGNPKPAGSKTAYAIKKRDGSYVKRANGSLVINVTDASNKQRKLAIL